MLFFLDLNWNQLNVAVYLFDESQLSVELAKSESERKPGGEGRARTLLGYGSLKARCGL